MCEQFTALPVEGGILDQPLGLMRQITSLRSYKSISDAINDENVKPESIPESGRELYFKVKEARALEDELTDPDEAEAGNEAAS